jgi:hypothetical protein
MGPAVDALTSRLYQYWTLQCDVPGRDKINVVVRFKLKPGGYLDKGPELGEPERSDLVWKTAKESAFRAVKNAAPFSHVPDELTKDWLRVTFDAEDACRRR